MIAFVYNYISLIYFCFYMCYLFLCNAFMNYVLVLGFYLLYMYVYTTLGLFDNKTVMLLL